MVNTRRVKGRRQLRFGRLEDILADVESLGRSRRKTLGNWSDAEIVDHIAALIDLSLDGFEAKAPLPLRLIGKFIRNSSLNRPMPTGYKIPGRFPGMQPRTGVTWEQAVEHLRRTVSRIQNGERMTHASPILGELSHEEWIQFHCRHAEMHLSFVTEVE